MNMNIYISPKNEALLRNEESMSGLINRLLTEHYGKTVKIEKKPSVKNVPKTAVNIPGVIKASEAPTPKCKGTHYMDRTNCGKQGCPWK